MFLNQFIGHLRISKIQESKVDKIDKLFLDMKAISKSNVNRYQTAKLHRLQIEI